MTEPAIHATAIVESGAVTAEGMALAAKVHPDESVKTDANDLTANDAVVRLEGTTEQFRISRALLQAWITVTGTQSPQPAPFHVRLQPTCRQWFLVWCR